MGCVTEAGRHVVGIAQHVRAEASDGEVLGLALEHHVKLEIGCRAHKGQELEGIAEIGMPGPDRCETDLLMPARLAALARDFAQLGPGVEKWILGRTPSGHVSRIARSVPSRSRRSGLKHQKCW